MAQHPIGGRGTWDRLLRRKALAKLGTSGDSSCCKTLKTPGLAGPLEGQVVWCSLCQDILVLAILVTVPEFLS